MYKYIFLLLIVSSTTCVKAAEIYKVGGSSGWTIMDYKSWAANIYFHVGDTLLFEYNKEHNVARVTTHKEYSTCNSTASMAIWATGNDSFEITRPGHYYFICGLGDCQSGHKVGIWTTSTVIGLDPSPSPSGPITPVMWVLLAAIFAICLILIGYDLYERARGSGNHLTRIFDS